MIRTIVTRLSAVMTTILALVVVTAGKAAAMNPIPDPTGQSAAKPTTAVTPVQTVVDGSNSTLQWALFVATIVVALAVGAGLMHLVERRAHRGQLA